jgi:hypothetical protein
VEAALDTTKKVQKERFEAGKNAVHVFKVGDPVYLSLKDIQVAVPSCKLAPGYLGPYIILEKFGELDYKLDLPCSLSCIHPVFHINKLFPFRGNEVNSEQPPEPGPVELEAEDDTGEPEWEVEEIVDSHLHYNKLQYLICWKGYSSANDSWEYATNVESPILVEAFHCQNPSTVAQSKPRRSTRWRS